MLFSVGSQPGFNVHVGIGHEFESLENFDWREEGTIVEHCIYNTFILNAVGILKHPSLSLSDLTQCLYKLYFTASTALTVIMPHFMLQLCSWVGHMASNPPFVISSQGCRNSEVCDFVDHCALRVNNYSLNKKDLMIDLAS